MRVLFLDIDGVLRTTGHIDILEPALILNLKRIVEEAKVEIVLSSDWRKKFIDRQMVIDQLGFFGLKLFDCTSVRLSHRIRWCEIQEWLDEHKEVERFVIVDDDEDARIPDNPNTFFFTDWKKGLTKEKADEIIKFFFPKIEKHL